MEYLKLIGLFFLSFFLVPSLFFIDYATSQKELTLKRCFHIGLFVQYLPLVSLVSNLLNFPSYLILAELL